MGTLTEAAIVIAESDDPERTSRVADKLVVNFVEALTASPQQASR